MSIDKSWNAMILKGVGEGICVFCQREGDSLISSFACPSFIYGPCLSGVLCAVPRGSVVLLGSQPAALCLLKCQEVSLLTPENYSADCSAGRTMISRESLLVKSDLKKVFWVDFFWVKLLLPCCFCLPVSSRLDGKSFLVVPESVPAIEHGWGRGEHELSIA